MGAGGMTGLGWRRLFAGQRKMGAMALPVDKATYLHN